MSSPEDMANALVNISAYSEYRRQIEQGIFDKEEIDMSMNISGQIATGFTQYMKTCIKDQSIKEAKTVHPFDSHPPICQRVEAVGVKLSSVLNEEVLLQPIEDSWYKEIDNAAEIENQQWAQYQDKFRKAHEQSLAYRYLPSNGEEARIVENYFPKQEIEGKKSKKITIDYQGIHYSEWNLPIQYKEITQCKVYNVFNRTYLTVQYCRMENSKEKLCVSGFNRSSEEVLAIFNHYYSRYLAARDYQKQKKEI